MSNSSSNPISNKASTRQPNRLQLAKEEKRKLESSAIVSQPVLQAESSGGDQGPPADDPPSDEPPNPDYVSDNNPFTEAPVRPLGEILSGTETTPAQMLQGPLTALIEQMNHGPIKEIAEFSELRRMVHTAYQTVISFEEYKRKHSRRKVQAASFSDVRSDHYNALGVADQDTQNPKSLEMIVESALSKGTDHGRMRGITILKERLEEFWARKSRLMNQVLSDILDVTGRKPEATGRLIIDQFLLQGIKFFKENNRTPLLFPELNITTRGKSLIINHEHYSTLLTGTVDYAMFFTDLPIEAEEREKILGLSSLQALTEHLLTIRLEKDGTPSEAPEGPGTKKSLKDLMQQGLMYLCLVEAKKRGYDNGLKKLIPQVAAESIATIEILEVDCLPWCLTTGTQWIFGVVGRRRKAKKTESKYKLKYTLPFELGYDSKKGETNEESVRTILNAIIIWSTRRSENLYTLFED